MLINLLNKFREDKTKCFINGIPQENGGTIVAIIEDYIMFEIEDRNAKPKTKEIVYMPISQIATISAGEGNAEPIEIFSEGKSITIAKCDIARVEGNKVVVKDKRGEVEYPIDEEMADLLKSFI